MSVLCVWGFPFSQGLQIAALRDVAAIDGSEFHHVGRQVVVIFSLEGEAIELMFKKEREIF